MARASRGSSRNWDGPLSCTPAPLPVLVNIGGGQLGIDSYDVGLSGDDTTTVQVWTNGVLSTEYDVSWVDLISGAFSFDYSDGQQWKVRVLLPDGTGYCSGYSGFSNTIDT